MSQILTLQFNDAELDRLRLAAERVGVTPEAFAHAIVVQSIDRPRDEKFEAALNRVLTKNKELYERLAR